MKNILVPLSIIIGFTILGAFYFASQNFTPIKVDTEKKESEVFSKENNSAVTSEEVNRYLSATGEIMCDTSSGSGFFWMENNEMWVVTNKHVVEGETSCQFLPEHSSGQTWAAYRLDLSSNNTWNGFSDIVRVRPFVAKNDSVGTPALSTIDDKGISKLRFCVNELLQGSPLVLIGYPAFAVQTVQIPGTNTLGTVNSRQVTNGIVSGYDQSGGGVLGSLPYVNYYVSAKIDSGNSGGPVFAKDNEGLCFLGVATWLNVGNYDTQGIVQNIHNIVYKN